MQKKNTTCDHLCRSHRNVLCAAVAYQQRSSLAVVLNNIHSLFVVFILEALFRRGVALHNDNCFP